MRDTVTVWVNDEEHKIPIHDGKIQFTDGSTGASFSLYVTQVKGEGVASADKIKILSDRHKTMINSILASYDTNYYTADGILDRVKFFLSQRLKEGQHLNFKDQQWRLTISELLRKGVFSLDKSNFYTMNLDYANHCVESGKF